MKTTKATGWARVHGNWLMLIPLLALLLAVAMWSAVLSRIATERSQAIAEGATDSAGFARTFAERTRRLLREIDQATRFLKLEFEQREARGERLDLAEYSRRNGLLPTDVTLRISIVGERGDVIASNKAFTPTNVSDRSYFEAHRTSDSDELLVSPPFVGRSLKRVVIAHSRRLNHGDGTFAGIVVMAVDPEYFTVAYEPTLLREHGFVALLGTDGRFRAARIGDKALLDAPGPVPAFEQWAIESQETTTVLESPFDGTRRIFSSQRVVDFPLIAIAGVSEDEVLAGFHRQRTLYLDSAAIASAVICGVAVLVLLQGLRLQTSRRNDRESVARLRLITDNMPALISYLDADQRIRFANRAYRDWLGIEPDSLVGKTLLEAYGSDVYAEIRSHIEAALAGRPLVYERELTTIDGKRPVSVAAVPHRDEEGRVVGLFVMTTDLTLQRSMTQTAKEQTETIELAQRRGIEQDFALQLAQQSRDAAEHANLAKSAFLATMSHEIRTPMNGVVGMIDVLAQTSLTADQADSLSTIRTSALSLLGSIDDILDFSKIEAGGLDLERRAIALTELVEGVCNSLGTVAASKGVALRIFIAPRTPLHVWGDPTRLRQVLYNLVGNAIKFSAGRPHAAGVVSLRVDVANGAPPRLTFVISDNGIGISTDSLGRLFRPFVQAESSTTRRFGGTGLGLVISKRLVDLMGGDIRVLSEAGAGSTFTVILPLEEADAPFATTRPGLPKVIAAAAPEAGTSGGEGHLVLVAEDDDISQKVIRRQLALLGYTAEVVGDGAQALRRWRTGGHALLITDLHMPEMDGYMLAEAIRREEQAPGRTGPKRIPILALTANAQHEESTRVRSAGMDDHLTKPIQLAVLRAALDQWLPHAEPARAGQDDIPLRA